ncbi:MAG: hypothetical protein ACYCX8_07315 [Acidimicrobiales bacterium]
MLSARGYEVGLYNTPQSRPLQHPAEQIVRQVTSAGPWDAGRLADLVERSFTPVVAGTGSLQRR